MTHTARRLGALLAVTAAALAAFAMTHTTGDSPSSTRADSVWMVPADPTPAPATPSPTPTPDDSVWKTTP